MGLRADPKMEGKQKVGFYDFGQGRGFWGCHVHLLGFNELLVFCCFSTVCLLPCVSISSHNILHSYFSFVLLDLKERSCSDGGWCGVESSCEISEERYSAVHGAAAGVDGAESGGGCR